MFDLNEKLEQRDLTLSLYDYYQDLFGNKSWYAIWRRRGEELCRVSYSDFGLQLIDFKCNESRQEIDSVCSEFIAVLRKSPIYRVTLGQNPPRGLKKKMLYLSRIVVGEKMFLAKLSHALSENILLVDPTDTSKIATIRIKATRENIQEALKQYPGLVLINRII